MTMVENNESYRFTVNCEVFSFSNVETVLDNSTSFIIEATGFPYRADISYQAINDTHYQWCGPMMLIAQYLAKWINAR